jgi:hypothetical protein
MEMEMEMEMPRAALVFDFHFRFHFRHLFSRLVTSPIFRTADHTRPRYTAARS